VSAPGANGRSDAELAKWCARNGRILIAIDDNHLAAGDARAYAFEAEGPELIWFPDDIKGPVNQLTAIVSRISGWDDPRTRRNVSGDSGSN
jgi:hypothetical protein